MKAIQIKYLGATNRTGSRFKAWTDAGSMAVGYNHALDASENALELAKAYCVKFNWPAPKGFGSLPNGDYVATLETA